MRGYYLDSLGMNLGDSYTQQTLRTLGQQLTQAGKAAAGGARDGPVANAPFQKAPTVQGLPIGTQITWDAPVSGLDTLALNIASFGDATTLMEEKILGSGLFADVVAFVPAFLATSGALKVKCRTKVSFRSFADAVDRLTHIITTFYPINPNDVIASDGSSQAANAGDWSNDNRRPKERDSSNLMLMLAVGLGLILLIKK